MSTITTFRGLIGALGGAAHAATLTGLPRRSIQAMADRDSIAADHWPAFVDAAHTNGLSVTLADFVSWRAVKRGTLCPDTPTLAPAPSPHHESDEECVA